MSQNFQVIDSRKKLGGGIVRLESTYPVERGEVAVTAQADKGIFSTRYMVVSKFSGTMGEGIMKGEDTPSRSIEVSPRRTVVRNIDGSVSSNAMRRLEPVKNPPKDVIAKGDQFAIAAEGPLEGVIAMLTSVDGRIGGPALDLLTKAVRCLVDVVQGRGQETD